MVNKDVRCSWCFKSIGVRFSGLAIDQHLFIMAESSAALKLPKISIRANSQFSLSTSNLQNSTGENQSVVCPLSARTRLSPSEILVILTILNNLLFSIEAIPLLLYLIQEFDSFSRSDFGSSYLDFKILNHYFTNSIFDHPDNDVATAIVKQHTRNALYFLSHNKLRFKAKWVERCVGASQHFPLKASESLMDVLGGFQKFCHHVKRSLAISSEENRQLETKLQQAKISIGKLTAKTTALESEIKKTLEYKNEQVKKRDAKIHILNADIETFISQSANRLEGLRQEQIAAIQRVNNYNLQREWIMHRKIKEISVEMRALRRANSDSEYLLKQRANDSEELVTELLKQYDSTMGFSKVTLSNVDYELQEEIRSLQHLENKAQQLEEELNQIVKEREMEEERRQQRMQKLKQRFRLIAKIHAYFSKQQKPAAAAAKSPKKKRSVNKKA